MLGIRSLSYFERYDRDNGQYDSCNPKTRYDFGFMVTFFLIMVVKRRHQKHPPSFSIFLARVLEVRHLHDDRQVFDQEYAAQHRNQQLLTDEHGKGGDDATNGQASGIAHEYLGWVGIIPQKSGTRAYKCSSEDYQLTRIGDVHDIEVIREDHVAGYIRKNGQCAADDGRRPRRQAVDAVRDIRAVGDGRDDNDHDHEEQQKHGGVPVQAKDAQYPRVIKLVV